MNIEELVSKFKTGEISVTEYTKETLAKIKANEYNAYISYNEEDSIKRAEFLEEKLKNGEKLGKLFGLPISVKDNISYKNMRMTCGSKMLEVFTPVYNATVVNNLLNEDAIIIAKTNMDEFAMGASSRTSYFGIVKNNLDTERIAGGSSSGSAVSVSNGDVLVSLGTDTGGSVRGPASYTNILGYKPTYSLMSRYGVVSMANTLDQVSLFAKNIEDMKLLASITSSCDSNDMTSILEEYEFIDEDYDFSGKKIGVISTDTDIYEGIEDTVKDDYKSAIERLEKLGAEIHTVDFKYAKFANPVYNVVMSSEVSSNMSRFDGIRFGHQTENYDNLDDLFIKSRSEGFGEEVQRRIALGTMYLSASDNQRIYKKGLQLRTLIKKELENLLKEYDLIITPTTTNLPTKITENKDNPLSDFKADGFNVIVNLAGMCGISVPVRSGLSGSIQFIGNRFDDNKILNAAQRFIKEAK
ncbi:Asp-tRNA(Asn)/Glu-tRNA(Gln) amidotransferase subunit GatA [Anaerococcus sp. Marseille-P9784]|uniref:Asp-tRNA(Asn)/Glu-tRNA(Gln) amidotransferase subunit GatA n=1 Tax=Anaerococcus sp. Marseille-P9784 TaxID=2614127 RepID=UPI00124A0809|nr:Asp-tRNA(Asn)/Glu-tRNA(Gln) amidotransferase subunit GatA [Anaerococcus sp. Marseille-P9784]